MMADNSLCGRAHFTIVNYRKHSHIKGIEWEWKPLRQKDSKVPLVNLDYLHTQWSWGSHTITFSHLVLGRSTLPIRVD